MELFSLTLRGFRRFKSETTLRTNGKVIAILGPNEAGKSSILHALTYLNHHNLPPRSDIARGLSPDEFLIKAKFLLSQDEAQAADLAYPQWVTIERRNDGTRYYGFDPPSKRRDTSLRRKALIAFNEAREHAAVVALEGTHGSDFVETMRTALEEASNASGETLSNTAKSNLSTSFATFAKLVENAGSRKVTTAVRAIQHLIDMERAPTPTRHAIDTLSIPEFLFFDEEARGLQSSYAIDALRSDVPVALQNFADIAELDFQELFGVIDAVDGAALATIERRANKMLEQKFGETWKQSEILVSLRLTPVLLEILVENEASEFSALAERSDGLRQFVALQTFVMRGRASQPILLVDEAESRLHYDAQADLVQMFARQPVASKVIYTTHSAGALPEDLGNGVRLIAVCPDDKTASQVVNKFWASEGEGFSPLLIGMGASTLAFFPTRRAVLVEGPSDNLLYPTLFREALGSDEVGFQFVPGLSSTAQTLAPLLPGSEKHVGFLVDGDPGGDALRKKLLAAGVDANRVVQLMNSDKSAVEPEDFITPSKLLAAANRLLERFHKGAELIKVEQLATNRRMSSLEAAYASAAGVKLPKVELAYALLDGLEEEPGSKLLDPRRAKAFGGLCEKVRSVFVSPAEPPI